jgi:hypothetical protein
MITWHVLMSNIKQAGTSPEEPLQRHILEPVTMAGSALDREYEEVAAEQRAFEQFRGRMTAIETVSTASVASATRVPLCEGRSRAAERVRNAYRETVMSVDHYDRVYGESLVEHVAAELSPEVAAGFQRDRHLQFTSLFKQTVLTAVDSAIDQRETFCDDLDDERRSLKRGQDRLLAVLDELGGKRVPAGIGTDFSEALDEVAHQRQETFVSLTSSPRTDWHDLCGYLYADYGWTYPVLTAVTRLRGAANGLMT